MGSRLCVALLVALLTTSSAAAQNVTLNTYSAPFSSEDGLVLNRPTVLKHRQLSALVVLEYANDPLVLEVRRGNAESERARLVEHALTAHGRFAFGLYERLLLMVGLDGALAMSGDSYYDLGTQRTLQPADGTGLGDARIGARYRPFGDSRSLFALALQGQLTFTLAEAISPSQNLTGEDSLTGRPELLFELRPGPLHLTANVGALIRKNASIVDTELGDLLTFGIGATARLPGKLQALSVLGELHGSTTFSDAFGRSTTPLAMLFGVRAVVQHGFRLGVAAGPGLTRGVGSPDFRLLATLGFTAEHVLDTDNDGVGNLRDHCPAAREDRDGVADEDGCPESDGDGDQVPDAKDRCPTEPEDLDRFEDDDGCIDPDNDEDRIPDHLDACPLEPEDHDGFEDVNGCPDRG